MWQLQKKQFKNLAITITRTAFLLLFSALVSASAIATNWPMIARFALSHSEMNNAVEEFSDLGPYYIWQKPRWIGWFKIDYTEAAENGKSIRFVTSFDSLVGAQGFVYSSEQNWGASAGLPEPWRIFRIDP